jgi:hypothetical protein
MKIFAGQLTSAKKIPALSNKTELSDQFRYSLARHPACVSTGKRPNVGAGSLHSE